MHKILTTHIGDRWRIRIGKRVVLAEWNGKEWVKVK